MSGSMTFYELTVLSLDKRARQWAEPGLTCVEGGSFGFQWKVASNHGS